MQPIDDLHKVKTNEDHEVTKEGMEFIYKQYMTLLFSTAATFDVEKAPKGKCALREDSYANIYNMEGYLHKDDYEYI